MSPEKIKQMILEAIPDSQVEAQGADCSSGVIVTSPVFQGMPLIKQHRLVKDVFKAEFQSGELHALSIKTKIA
ncbi:MAG: BolA/IbaG family iron-sulfur metabolism protein [Thiotrichales bacterium]|nr:BolA/IbaG family iron-sulfur metabolism protein [Thiotrichales bacterium]